jgi:rubrerythrin
MSELLEIFRKYDCDKGDCGYNSHLYHLEYEKEFEKIRYENINILEVGVFRGQSLQAWLEYFPNANLHGIDIFTRVHESKIDVLKHSRVKYIKGSSLEASIKDTIKKNWGDIKFDVIIDDGLHTPDANKKTFENLISFLKNTGVFYIEDAWPLHCMNEKELSHHWIKKHHLDYTQEHMTKFLHLIEKYNVEEVDLRNVSGSADSYIFKITK